ncbi:SRPBCC family protein [Phenylobacterium terrae]|uniref:SRPBCC family protein n=1 Tax=Phenylobacterium terrae TaxID=2665495 RepID=A0ABW4N139_9CAUL
MIDVSQHLGALVREVSSREVDGRPARVVTATRTYDTDVEDLWDALTSAERIPRWFLPISGELKLGGRYQLQGQAGGEIQRCEPPRLLGVTWENGGDVSWVTVRLEAEGEARTQLTLEHVAHVKPEFWDQYGPGAVGVGWELLFVGMALHLRTGEQVDSNAFEAWTLSEDGKRFIRGSSQGWGDAALRDGADRAWAQAAVARTSAFYTGEPSPDA